jgi:hypothetical protein
MNPKLKKNSSGRQQPNKKYKVGATDGPHTNQPTATHQSTDHRHHQLSTDQHESKIEKEFERAPTAKQEIFTTHQSTDHRHHQLSTDQHESNIDNNSSGRG